MVVEWWEPEVRSGQAVRTVLYRPPTDKLAHDRIAAHPVGVIDVFISGQARENRLPQKASESPVKIPYSIDYMY